VSVYICICVYVCVGVCMRVCVCVYMCVCVRRREQTAPRYADIWRFVTHEHVHSFKNGQSSTGNKHIHKEKERGEFNV